MARRRRSKVKGILPLWSFVEEEAPPTFHGRIFTAYVSRRFSEGSRGFQEVFRRFWKVPEGSRRFWKVPGGFQRVRIPHSRPFTRVSAALKLAPTTWSGAMERSSTTPPHSATPSTSSPASPPPTGSASPPAAAPLQTDRWSSGEFASRSGNVKETRSP